MHYVGHTYYSYVDKRIVPPSNINDAVKLGEEEIPCTNTFKYIGSIFAAEGQKHIARTECDCHGINGEKRRVSFATRKCQ